jgi:uncharacterized protein
MMIGRDIEIKEMQKLIQTSDGEMLAVLGRRRVGKTYLIREVYKNNIALEVVGLQNASTIQSLTIFKNQIKKYFGDNAPSSRPKSWLEAFNTLADILEKTDLTKKKVLFFDEVPWLGDSSKKKFIEALGHFWNSWASNHNVIVVICGSAASWILNHIVNTKGGLYNRITKQLYLKPFTLYETKKYLKSNGVVLDHNHIIKIYMAFGGIPHYLKQVEPGLSATEVIQKICFETNGALYTEFENLYKALFKGSEVHIAIVKALQTKWHGLSRQELLAVLNKKDGGNITETLNELIQCNFVLELPSYTEKKNHKVFRLIDEFSIFYLSFMQNSNSKTANHWLKKSQTQEYKIWCGYAFENLCFRHTRQIIHGLGLNVIHTEFSSFYHKGNSEIPGTQIDMVLDRADQAINIFEIKYYDEPFILTKKYAHDLRTKIAIFKAATKTKKQIFLTTITIHGLLRNEYTNGFIMNDIVGDDLFVK